jgi:hypothetical protein
VSTHSTVKVAEFLTGDVFPVFLSSWLRGFQSIIFVDFQF